MLLHLNLLLDADLTQEQWVKLLSAAGVVVVILLVGFVVVSQVKKRIQTPDEPAGSGFSLSDLRQLYKQGQMSAQEFEKAKAKVVEAARRAAERAEARRESRPKGPDKSKRLF
jgi:biopolymer transport protein ExbB/TolQ